MKRNTPPPAKSRIILVDDHPLVRERLAELINQQADLQVCGECGDDKECLAFLEKTVVDMAIVDLTLKGAHGIDLIKDLQVRYPKLCVLVLSMHDEILYAERALRAGARGYVTKQEASQTIMTAIRTVLAGETYLNEKMARQLIGSYVRQRRADKEGPIQRLTDRELEVFQLMGEGHSTRVIGEILKIDPKTVDSYRARIKEKLNISSIDALRHHAREWAQQAASKPV